VFLVDTSAWIELLARPARLRMEDVGEIDEVVTCLPVIQELLQGVRDESLFRRAREAIWSFPIVESPLGPEVFAEAVELYRAARRAGITIRSSVDCLIATCGLRHGLEVVHVDRDFAALARVAPLEQRALKPRRLG
jgi:predicted nucleic acid-binding protein